MPLRNLCTEASRPSTSKISNIDGPTAWPVSKSAQRCFRSLNVERLDSFQLIRETVQQLSQARLLAQVLVNCGFVKVEIVREIRAALLRKILQREITLSNQ